MRNNRNSRLWRILTLMLTVGACEKPKAPPITVAGQVLGQTVSPPPIQSPANVLAQSDNNRVLFVSDSDSSYVVWDAKAPWGRRSWKSGNTYGGRPRVELADIDGDGALDLFWAMQNEEDQEGMIVLNKKDQFHERIPRVDQCQLPELGRIKGRYVYVAYVPGAYELSACQDPVVGLNCATNFGGNWPRFYAVDSAITEIVPDRDTYLHLAARFRTEAARFDSVFAADTRLPNPQRNLAFCDSAAGQRMSRLADSVDRLAR
jgi:hypothetical protein